MKEDIFDRMMHLPLLRIFEPFYRKHKEVLMYLLFGGIAFFLNIFLFLAIDRFLPIGELINNIICWVVCVLFQFFTNRTWVFEGHVERMSAFLGQMGSFFGGRIFTLAVEEILLAVFITWLAFPTTPVKLAAQVVVIASNYFISKLVVFREKEEK